MAKDLNMYGLVFDLYSKAERAGGAKANYGRDAEETREAYDELMKAVDAIHAAIRNLEKRAEIGDRVQDLLKLIDEAK